MLTRTWLGHAITAAAENPEGARLIGVEPKRIGTWIFAIATATTAFGGAALSFLYQFTPDSQDTWIGLTLSVVILGGLGSVTGAFAAGVLLGLAESVTSTYISVRWSEAVPTILILLVLLIRPQGLFTLAASQAPPHETAMNRRSAAPSSPSPWSRLPSSRWYPTTCTTRRC